VVEPNCLVRRARIGQLSAIGREGQCARTLDHARALLAHGNATYSAVLLPEDASGASLRFARWHASMPWASAIRVVLVTGERKHDRRNLPGDIAVVLARPFGRASLKAALDDPPDVSPVERTEAVGMARRRRLRSVGPLLVAEDNPVNQKILGHMLRQLGFTFDLVATGREAVAAMLERPYSLVLMDCHMPDMDGFEATAGIRSLGGSLGKTPILALTANAIQGDRENCLARGMDDYLSKPFRQADLDALLERWLPCAQHPA
jgi:CheY-like chemotaxis protein